MNAWVKIACNCIAIAALSFSTVIAAQPLSVSIWSPPQSLVPPVFESWGKQVEQATQGRVRLNILPKPVTNIPGHYDAVRNGLVDVSYVVLGSTPGRFTLPKLAELPFMGSSAEAMSVAFQHVHDKHFSALNEFAGVKVLCVFASGSNAIYTTKVQVRSLQDLQGLKIRVGAGTGHDLMKNLGAAATVKPISEMIELMSTGIVDGSLTTLEAAESFRLDRVAKYSVSFQDGFTSTAWAMVMNQGAWDRLSKQDQQAIQAIAGESLARTWGRAWDHADRRGVAFMQAAGVQRTMADARFASAIKLKVEPVVQEWVRSAQAKGLKNAPEVLQEFRAIAGKQ